MASLDVVLITGAGGMGLAIARRLANGHKLVLADYSPAVLAQAAAALDGYDVTCVPTDIASAASVELLLQRATALGRLAAMVHTAGVSPASVAPGLAEGHAAADDNGAESNGSAEARSEGGGGGNAKRIYETNLLGTALLIDAVLPHATPGLSVVCIASIAGHWARASMSQELTLHLATAPTADLLKHAELNIGADTANAGDTSSASESNDNSAAVTAAAAAAAEAEAAATTAYLVSKRGNQVRIESAARAYGQRGARINSVSPGIIVTPMLRREMAAAAESTRWLAQMAADAPLPRFGTADEVAGAVAFLCGPDAAYVMGADLVVDGGMRAMVGLEKAFVTVHDAAQKSDD